MSTIFEKRFKVTEVFDINNEYDLWIISFATARQDINLINKKIAKILFDDNAENKKINKDNNIDLIYYSKMNIGHIDEAIKLLERAMIDDISNKKYNKEIKGNLLRIDGFAEKYSELLKLTDENAFYKNVLEGTRNSNFHYNKGKFRTQNKDNDFNDVIKTLQYLNKDNFISGFKICDKKADNDFYFADEIQMNWFIKLGEDYNLNANELLTKISKITYKVIEILSLIVDDFLINRVNWFTNNLDNNSYTVKYNKNL